MAGEQEDPGSLPRIFFQLNLFLRGNELNGEQEQEELK